MAEINRLTNLTSPVGTESIPVEEAGGTLKRILVSWFAKASWFDVYGTAKKSNLTSAIVYDTAVSVLDIAVSLLNAETNQGDVSFIATTNVTTLPYSSIWFCRAIANAGAGFLKLEVFDFASKGKYAAHKIAGSWQAGVVGSWWDPVQDSSGNAAFPSVTTTASAANAYIGANGTTILKSTSSKRYKTNILPLADSSIIDSMKPITYTSDPDTVPTDDPDLLHYGFIAEDLAEIDPKLVQYTENEKGELIPDGVQYDRITVLLVKRIQELEARLKKAGI